MSSRQWMARSAALVDEIWTYSRHAAEAIAPACAVPVHVFAPPVTVPDRVDDVDRAAMGVTDDFTFLFCFDFAQRLRAQEPVGRRAARSAARSRRGRGRAS